ncbi:MAG: amidohydrolase [Ruminococcaceae bacterium]|nr:amidohydrolase [Oscillospiraceae bacterium]
MENVKNIQKIDIHAHAVPFPDLTPRCPGCANFSSAEEVLGVYDRLGVEKGVLLPLVSPDGIVSPMTAEATKLLADKYPDRFLWFANVDPRAAGNHPGAPLDRLIGHYKELGAKGIGEITAGLYLDDPRLENLFACCAEAEMPVTIHISVAPDSYGVADALGLPRLEKILKKFPNLKLLGHSQVFWSEISADNNEEIRNTYPSGKVTDGRVARLMREYPNLYCDLSAGSGANAFMRDPEYAARFIEEFSDRILYGIDLVSKDSRFPLDFCAFFDNMLDEGTISPENYRKIFRENAEKLLKL